ncbi:NAD(P)/FAD-dependent oxidoreductase [Nocardiopsis alborubida]|uniref:Oxidoreductase n=1 Tax=Nocardiopsis alborubida TaxID=146802 RepID=A0A7X6M9L5_9ACTN|nr:FAD-dependent monooxygenase [Nocardiopsis alborubida]NKY97197.1 oxidoreductase [Nocardiopsis alborubida]
MSSANAAAPHEHADVVIVGSRIAGASLAAHLAASGRRVVVVDRARFPSDTLSTHLIQVSGVRSMQKLGVLDRLTETGAPFLTGASVTYDGIDLSAIVHAEEGWPPGGISVNRNLLDEILVNAARDSGAQVRTRTNLVGACRDDSGRVSRVLVRTSGEVRVIEAPLVIGADGRNSRLAELVGARAYNTTPNERFAYWADYEGAASQGPAVVRHHREGRRLTIAFDSDSGRFTVLVCPELPDFGAFKRSLPDSFDDAVARCEPLRPVLAGARRVTRPVGTAYLPGYFRESAGRGWALIGDAGHFKDPTLGQGISDALRQSEVLAEHLSGVDLRAPDAVDRAVRSWARWRDRDAAAMYWLGWDFARAGELGDLERSLLRKISESPVLRRMFVDGALSHRVSPNEILGPGLLLRAAYDMGLRGTPWTGVVGQVGRRLAVEARRQWSLFRPRRTRLPKPAGSTSSQVRVGGQAWAGDIVDEVGGAAARGTEPVAHRTSGPTRSPRDPNRASGPV